MTDDEDAPETEPSGNLEPPGREPPTAVGTAAPPPAPGERPLAVRAWRRRRSSLATAVHTIFDALDSLADAIAEKTGLRARP